MNETWYQDTNDSPFKSDFIVQDKSKYDVLIVGAGLAGLSLLYHLTKGGVNALLLESNSIGSGASGRNGGFCLSGWAQDYDVLLKYLNIDIVRELENIAALGVSWMRRKCMQNEYQAANLKDGVVNCFLTGSVENIKRETDINNNILGTADQFISKKDLNKILSSDKYLCGVKKENGFHFHPLNFMNALAKECNALEGQISENSKFLNYRKEKREYLSKIRTKKGIANIFSKKIVFATGGYGGNELNDLRKYWLPIKTFIGVTEPLGFKVDSVLKKSYAISDNRRAGNYYRILPDKRLSWGRGISAFGNISNKRIKEQVSKEINFFFPQLGNVDVQYAWSGIMAYASHFMPYVGPVQIGAKDQGVFAITGFGGHGMNTASGAAIILSEFFIEGKKSYKIFNNFERKWNGGFLGPYVAELKYKYIQAKDFIDVKMQSNNLSNL